MSHACSRRTDTEPTEASAPITAELLVAEVSRRPGALEVLQRLGINHCCGAHLSLREAAAAAGISLEQVLSALDEASGVVA